MGALAAATLVLAAIDYAVKNYQYEKKLKMSDKEIKDEHKNTEGDGEIKGKRKAMARDLLQQLTTEGVKGADVVVVNPTHFSVALKYDRESMAAPRVVAKGVDQRAMRIRQIARENGVPIVSEAASGACTFPAGEGWSKCTWGALPGGRRGSRLRLPTQEKRRRRKAS